VADFIGETNWISARVKSATPQGAVLESAIGAFEITTRVVAQAGEAVWLGFRPEAVSIGASATNSLETTIAHVCYLGEIEQYGLEVAPGQFIKAFEQNPLDIRRVGEALTVHVRPQDFLVVPER
jgi:ABC-type Fe3+/spermidine/putrescine transport system ATPase subunit